MILLPEGVEIAEPITACRRPKDDKFLAPAVSGTADDLLTGDLGLLVMDPFRGVRILTPAGFLAAVGAIGSA